MQTITERRVSYWAVQGERWCNVDGVIRADLVKEWEASNWRIVTRVTEREVEVMGDLEL